MHDYSIDGHPKEKILFLLAFVAIALAPKLNSWLNLLVEAIGSPYFRFSAPISAVPVFGLFLLVFYLFNSHLWKWRSLRKLLLVPDLNGIWRCEGRGVLRGGEEVDAPWEATITITQSWSKISILMTGDASGSKSVAASLHREPGIGYRLLYHYENGPKADQIHLEKHSGSSEMLIQDSCVDAEGHYFTDQHRRTVGTMKWRKIADEPTT